MTFNRNNEIQEPARKKKKNYQSRIGYPEKLLFRKKGEIKNFSGILAVVQWVKNPIAMAQWQRFGFV